MKIAIGIIHGMGSQKRGFSQAMQEKLMNAFRKIGGNSDDLLFQELFWADILSERQERLFRNANYRDDLSYSCLRKFFIGALGDAIAYQDGTLSLDSNSVYYLIHERVGANLHELWEKAGEQNVPLVLMGHSLGGVILSNYIWDLQKSQREGTAPGFRVGDNPFENLYSLIGLITFGTTIALWSLRFHEFDRPISFPPELCREVSALEQKARWLNFYDRDDVLAYPLKHLSPAYENLSALEDVEVNVGNVYSSWNPLSHQRYWEDKNFLRPVARFLYALVNHERGV